LQLCVKPYKRELDDRRRGSATGRSCERRLLTENAVNRLMMLGHMVLFLTFIAAMVTNLCDADDTLCDSFGFFGSHYAVLLVCSIYGKRCGRRLP